ncbi:hypothetical protein E2C01_045069 [Portunus trituberculatus]|uniref:Uncharacterized protein n=1 Tax=Portunus trituberculatus TaxID=210409 RepID=A0A5B7G421_PORTR|nr:hypothetical protein [Portunus trituberculatus]
MFMCCLKLLRWVNVLPHSSHTWIFACVWMLVCRVSISPHSSHSNFLTSAMLSSSTFILLSSSSILELLCGCDCGCGCGCGSFTTSAHMPL